MKIMTASNLFGLNFLQRASGGRSTPIVGDYDPQSQTWGGIVTAQSAGGCANECFNCCGNSTRTRDVTVSETRYTTYDGTDIATQQPGGGVDYSTDDCTDVSSEGDVDYE
jgi:hypothetical protein